MQRLINNRNPIVAVDDRGVAAVEYGLIVALIAVAIIAALVTAGPNLSTIFTTVATWI